MAPNYIMKNFVLIMALLCSMVSVSAQNVSKNCYRGLIDLGYAIGLGDYKMNRFEVNTTHGYQASPHFFIGAGTGLHFMPKYETPDMEIALDERDSSVEIPIYANLKINFTKSKVAPFIDIKAGSYVTNNSGLYTLFSAGCRIATNQKCGLNISLGYSYSKLEYQTFSKFIGNSISRYTRTPSMGFTEALAIKLGFEF